MNYESGIKFFSTLCFIFLILLLASPAQGDVFNSDNFQALDPVMNAGGYGSSASFKLFGSISEIAIGTSTSATFKDSAGFLYFPFATTPVVTATAGDGQVALSWTASAGYLGWTASSYNIGRSTDSGGPYTYSSSVTSPSTVTGLTNSTAYYFVIVAKDAFGNAIATSTQSSAITPVAPVVPPPSGGGGGGGGGSGAVIPTTPATGAIFSGRAYPKSKVTLLKDAQVAAVSNAGMDANFQISLTGLSAGNYIFSVYSEDTNGLRSSLLTFPTSLTSGATTQVSGIFIAPTIAVDKSEVKRGDNVAIFGQSAPQADIIISVNSDEEFFGRAISNKDGTYLYNFDTSLVDYGLHSARSKAAIANQLISSFSYLINFKVGTKNVTATPISKGPAKADLNGDNRVNLVDFSIAAYWYKRPINAEFAPKEAERLNGDNKVDLVDFSIMAFYWTG